jgi:hypothetical protein
LVCAMPWALAQPSECGFIKDPDRQAYCRAVNGGSEAQCGFIRDSDLQARCRAESGGGASQCGFIRDKDAQAACRASLQSQRPGVGSSSGQCGFIQDADQQAHCRATWTSRPCAALKPAVVQVNVASSKTATCKPPAAPKCGAECAPLWRPSWRLPAIKI